MVKCPRCGYENPEGAKYCINCGYRLIKEERERLEGLGLLLIASGVYVLLAALFESFLRYFPLVLLGYLLAFVLSTFSGYELYFGRVSWLSVIAAALAIIIGLASSLWAFAVGLLLKGIFGPDWALFLIALIKMFADRQRLSSAMRGQLKIS